MRRFVWIAALACGIGCSGAPPRPVEQVTPPSRGALEPPFGSFEEAMLAHQQLADVVGAFDLPIGLVLESGPPCSIERARPDGTSSSARVRYDASGRLTRAEFEGDLEGGLFPEAGALVMTYSSGGEVMTGRFCGVAEPEQACASSDLRSRVTYDASDRRFIVEITEVNPHMKTSFRQTLALDPDDPRTVRGTLKVMLDGEASGYPDEEYSRRWSPGWVWAERTMSSDWQEVMTRRPDGHVVVRRLEAEPNERETYRRDEQGRVVEIVEETYDDASMLWVEPRVTRLSYDPEDPRRLVELADPDGGRVWLGYACSPQSAKNSP